METDSRLQPRALPFVLQSGTRDEDLLSTLSSRREAIEELRLEHGALLFRGFGELSQDVFSQAVKALGIHPGAYVGGNSPRTVVGDGVYTSTEYPADQEITLHNELSYRPSWPESLAFGCITPADQGGETSLADGRRILEDLDSGLVEAWSRRGLLYLRCLHGGDGLGRSWQATFETESRAEVGKHLAGVGAAFEWTTDGELRIAEECPAIVTHPKTGGEVWFNQAEQWHPSSLDAETRSALLAMVGEERLPHNVTHADGTPLDLADLAQIRAVLRGREQVIGLRRDDFLLFDNVAVMHGRKPFEGERRIVVAMG